MGEAITLYRFFDEDETLLYVGITGHLPGRLKQHADSQPWWTAARHITVEHYHSRAAALAAESDAIKAERPVWNLRGAVTPRPGEQPARRSERRAVERPTLAVDGKAHAFLTAGCRLLRNRGDHEVWGCPCPAYRSRGTRPCAPASSRR